jgi:plasmid stabilization system protein ParE
MTRRSSFHPLAEQELNEAASYYNTASPGLGTAFLDEVEHAVKQILEHPEAAPLVHGVVRRKLVRRFPYSVMYSV